ncbi:MAG TPA: hypothetical protein VM432_08575 [Bdellovibrionales bacterium]|jgi:hypothetical protein|nr:hypothetical protein [Bdellovibrionales bacterium]
MKSLTFLLGILTTLSIGFAHAGEECPECVQLDKIKTEFKAEEKKAKPDFDALQIKASLIIEKMPATDGSMNAQKLDSYVEMLRLFIPKDPARAILDNTREVMRANRKAVEARVKKLSPEESKTILRAIDVLFKEEVRGSDPSSK